MSPNANPASCRICLTIVLPRRLVVLMQLLRAWIECFAAPRRARVRPSPPLAAALALVGLLAPLAVGSVSATELLEARVTAGAETVLQNAGGTVRLERARVDATDHQTFFVPEPGALWQLGSGVGLLALLSSRRRSVASRSSSAVGS